MHKIALGLLAATLFAAPAFAQAPLTFVDVDSDGDGRLSFEELQVVWPNLTQEEFVAADADAAGSLTPDQLNTLQPSSMPTPEPLTAPVESTDTVEPAESLVD